MTDEHQIDNTTVNEKNSSNEIEVIPELLNLTDTSTDPTTNGDARLNGSDVVIYSGGAVRNLSDLGQQSTTTSTVTATGGSEPADSGTIAVGASQTTTLVVRYNVNADPSFDANYAAELNWWTEWDDGNSDLDIGYQLVWQTDPGSSNDVDYQLEVITI